MTSVARISGRPISRAGFVVAAATLVVLAMSGSVATAQPMAPQYAECRLDSIYPNGGRRGTTVKVELRGSGHGLQGPKEVVIDGPPGITVKELKWTAIGRAVAELEIAPDAPLGRRWLRVLNERSGLTNFAYFVVSDLPEVLEAEPNADAAQAQRVDVAPVVVNGRVDPQADVDFYRFPGRAGQKIVAAIAAHALDVHGQYKSYGIADFSLELTDAAGRTLASAEDTIGFDPLVEATLPADGEYLVRVQLLNFGGFPEAVYRLTFGATPYVVGAFPPGVRRGVDTEVELFGPNVPPGTKQRVPGRTAVAGGADVPAEFVLRHVTLQQAGHAGLDVPLAVGDQPQTSEVEGNDVRTAAMSLAWPIMVNGRFDRPGDADWYRVRLAAGQKVWFEIVAQRFIRSPVDTLLQVFDESGKLLGENDDEVFEPGYECYHDFKTTDSKYLFTAPAAGEFLVRVTEQTGEGGPRAVYQLTVEEARPDFRLTHFPDAIPVWGPGSTAGVLVRIDRFAGCDEDIEVSLEGLPTGWSSSSAVSLGGRGVRPYNTYQLKVFLTVTAPHDAPVGTMAPVRIVGRAKRASGPASVAGGSGGAAGGGTPAGSASGTTELVERVSIPLTLFYTSDTGFFRAAPRSRVAVAKAQGPWLEAVTRELTLTAGEAGVLQVKVRDAGAESSMPLVVNVAMAGVGCAMTSPQLFPIKGGVVEVPIKVPADVYPGSYGLVVAQTWGSDIRVGMPGPCTPLLRLHVRPKD